MASEPNTAAGRTACSRHRGGRQFHDRGSLLLRPPLVGGLSPLLRTPLPRSDTAPRISFEDFLVRRCERSVRNCR